MDGEAAAGESTEYSRGDHVHPTDTSRASVEDATLNPIYDGGTPTYSEWVCDPPEATVGWDDTQFDGWYISYGGSASVAGSSDPDATSLSANFGSVTVVATRTITNFGGYVLGGDEPGNPNHGKYLAGIENIPDVVAPSTAPAAAGKPADAKATGDALAGKQGALTAAQLANIADVPNKADTSDVATALALKLDKTSVVPPTDRATAGQAADAVKTYEELNKRPTKISVNEALAQKADASDLPYRLVEPGKWGYELPEGMELVSGLSFETGSGDTYNWAMEIADEYGNQYSLISQIWSDQSHENDLSVTVTYGGGIYSVTATRASLPGHILDRAGNLVVVTGDTTLTLPAVITGHLRDFLVRLEISGSTVPTITFAAPTGETLTYETDGDEFPVPDEAGTWVYSFTENCVAHKFAVALKKVNAVTQGGS